MTNQSRIVGVISSLLILVGGLWSLHETQDALYSLTGGRGYTRTRMPQHSIEFLIWTPLMVGMLQGGLALELVKRLFSSDNQNHTTSWKLMGAFAALSVLYFEFEGCDRWVGKAFASSADGGPFFEPYRQNESVMMYWGLLFLFLQHRLERREQRPQNDLMSLFGTTGNSPFNSMEQVQSWTTAQKQAIALAMSYVSAQTDARNAHAPSASNVDVSEWLGKVNLSAIHQDADSESSSDDELAFIDDLLGVDARVVVALLIQTTVVNSQNKEASVLAVRRVAKALGLASSTVDDMLN